MDDLERMAAERACEALMTSYTHLVDSFGERASVPELFTEDGVWESDEARLEGREQMAAFFGKAVAHRTTRHVTSNASVRLTGPDTAEGLSYFTLYLHVGEKPRVPDLDDQPIIVGQYTDRFVCGDDGWRFTHRRADVGFVRRSALKK
ncbi:MAG: nuclear transport factor 2 family protein [Acidimicrobiales bacterium]